jgi:hypothetical protein
MRKLIASVLFTFILFLPFSSVTKSAFAQEDMVTTTSEDTTTSSDGEYYYDDSYYDDYDYETYDDYYSDYGYDYDLSTETATGTLAGIIALLFGGVMLFVSIVVGLGSYIYCSLALMKLAKRMNYENAWYAWIPILNMILLFQLGEQKPILLLLLLIPGIGELVVGILIIIALMKICEKRGYDKTLGLLSLVPIANYVLLGILAWGKKEA